MMGASINVSPAVLVNALRGVVAAVFDTLEDAKAINASYVSSTLFIGADDGGAFVYRGLSGTPGSGDGGVFCGTYFVDAAGRRWDRDFRTRHVCASWFGVVADWNGATGTDNKARLQAAVDAGYGAVYVDRKGRVYTSGSITHAKSLYLFSDNVSYFPDADGNTSLETDGDEYIVAAAANKLQLTVSGLAFVGANHIDLRPTTIAQTGENKIVARHCGFSSESNDYGVAIMGARSDFSTIELCNFYAFKGLCAIRFGGNVNDSGAGTYANSYLVTALTLRKNTFSKDTLICVSVELCNSVKIEDNDFGGGSTTRMHRAVDVGGFRYNVKVRASSKYAVDGTFYNRATTENGGPNAFNFAGSDFLGSGRFNGVRIREGHMESGDDGTCITAQGTSNNYGRGIKIEHVDWENNTATDGVPFADLIRCRNAITFANEGNIGALTTCSMVRFQACTNPRLILDQIITTGAYAGSLYSDAGSNSGVYKIEGNAGGVSTAAAPVVSGSKLSAQQVQYDMSADQGDADVVFSAHSSPTALWFNTPLTAARMVTLSGSGAASGKVRVVRGSGATGAFSLNVGPAGVLKALTAAGTWADFAYNDSAGAWKLTAAGSL